MIVAEGEDFGIKPLRQRTDLRILKSSSIPKASTPAQIPGSLVLDGLFLKLRAEDYSVVTFSASPPPPSPPNLQQTTTNGNTTTNNIVSGGTGFSISGGGLTVSGGTGITVNTGGATISGNLTTSHMDTTNFIPSGTVLMNGGLQQLYTTSGSLTVQSAANLVIATPTITLPQSTNFSVTAGGCNIISSTGDIISTTGVSTGITTSVQANKSVIIDGALGPGGSYRNFLIGDTFAFSKNTTAPTLAQVTPNTTNLTLMASSNMWCGQISLKNTDLNPWSIRLNFPYGFTGATELICLLSPMNDDEDFYSSKVRVTTTSVILNTVQIQGTPLVLNVTYNFSYFISCMS